MTAPDGVVAAQGSALDRIRAARQRKQQALHLDLPVPRWLDEGLDVHVRYRPIDQRKVEASRQRLEAADKKAGRKDPAAELRHNSTILAEHCVGIFIRTSDGDMGLDPEHPDDWPVFGPELGELLDTPVTSAAEAVRALYFTDGDALSASLRLAEWSGYTEQREAEADPAQGG